MRVHEDSGAVTMGGYEESALLRHQEHLVFDSTEIGNYSLS